MSGLRWDKSQSRDQMRRRGVDNIADQSAPYIPSGKPRRPRPTKDEMRKELERLMAARERPDAK